MGGRRDKYLPCLIILLFYFSTSIALENGRTLYINRDDEISTNKYKVINLNSDNTNGTVRKKRDAPISDVTSLNNKNISSWITHLNDSHQQLMVHWVGEGSSVIMCLARDPNPRPSKSRPSAVYISYDYGKTFQNKTEQFKLTSEMNSGYAQLDKMFNHPKYPSHCIFTDTANKIIFYTSDNGLHIGYTSLPFHPKMIAFDEELPEKFVVWDSEDPRKRLYLTEDGGRTFDMIQELVKSFYWTSGVDFPNSIFYYERLEPNGTSTVFSTPDPNSIDSSRILMRNVEDFLIKGEYMFATQKTKNSNMELYISYRRGAFYKAVFQTELDLKRFHISDVTSERLMVSVVHTEVMSNLYVSEMDSNRTQISFVLSLENIMCYFPSVTFKDSWLEDVAEEPFAELYKVEGMKGIYIASKFEGRTSMNVIGLEHLVSLITFDHGVKWSRITPPNMDENGMPISCGLENSCSLHLSQKFSHLYPVSSTTSNKINDNDVLDENRRSPSIMSSKSAPGLIIATGVLGKSMKGVPGVFISKDAGLSWRRIFKDYFFFNFGDHGGVLVAVRYYKSRGETRQLLFSTDEGATWGSFQFHDDDLRIYGLMTEPGENTTTFTMFGSANAQHQWIILTVDLLKAFNRTCTSSDYKFWSPTAANSSINCVMGLREIYERRIPNRNCYNGLDYNRPTQKQSCECSRRDYECAFGFTLSGKECIKSNTTKFDPYKIPASCQPGQYYKRTKGYRKIDGNQCVSDFYVRYEPEWTPCPMAETAEFMVLAVKDNLTRINLQDNTTITYPIKGLKNLVAVEFDMRNNCVYWADLDKDKITRQCLSGDSQPEIIVDYDLNSVEGMAFDWISNVLFFVDGTRRKIEAVSVVPSYGNRFRRTILDSDKLFKPRGITVHPKAGYLFWTDWDSQHVSVSRANLDGTNTIKLFSGPDVIWPNGITIDYTSDRIFWVDAMADYIGCSDLDGHYMRRIISDDSRVTHPFAIAVLKDKIYWDDWKVNSVFMADKDKGTNITVIKNMTATPMDLKVFAHFIQYGTNACTNNTICKYMCLGGPKNTYSCLCPDGLKEKNGKCLCPGDVEPDSNFVCPHKDVVCGNKEFQCMNGSCISSLLKCNRHNDCGDNSDEINCSRCPLGTFTCGGGGNKCLPNEWKCDGDFDCDDNSDEIGCERPLCTADQFRCKDGFCRSKEYLCDGDYDCKDGSDEANCKKTTQACRENDYKCPDTGRCIPYTWLCDGDVDCQGDEDPKMCSNITCQPNMFKCLGNGKCINNAWLCDGEDDCGDPQRSDEMNCTAKPVRPPATLIPTSDNDSKRCLDWMFTCANSKCVSLWWRCDGVDDCGDNSDEVGCPVKHPDSIITPPEPTQPTTVQLCGRDQFTCYKDRACIPQRWWCDGLIDCIDGSDERDCPFQLPMPSTPASSPCGPKQVECRSGGECISLNQLCDGNADCRDKSDEMHCSAVKYPVDCNPTSMMCDEGKRCIPLSKKCDGNIDCFDGTDEKDCLSSKYNVQLAVIAASTKNTSFEVHIWLSQKSGVNYTFLPSYTELGKNNWTNLTWTDKYYFKFVNMRPNTSYNVTCYVRDSSTNRTVPSNAYITVKTRFGVPPAPKKLEAIQLTGRRVRLVWDGTNDTSVTYAIKSSPQLPYIITHNTEINITSDFIPGQKYSFWVIATNPEHISEPSETAVLTFDSLGDVDDLVNASIVNRTDSSVTLKWNRIPGVEGYTVRLKLPKLYAQVEPIVTKENVATVNDLPPGLSLYIELRAFKNGIKGTPLTIPYKTVGVERQSVDNVTVKSVKGQFNTYEVSWSQTKVSGQQYEVHYTNGKLSDLFNAPEVVTTANKIIISNLTECSQYLIAVSLYRGPLSEPIMIQTDTKNISVSSLKADVNKATSELIVSWSMTCNVIKEPIRYMVELVEENTNRVSSYLLNATLNYNLVHIVRGLPTGAKFTVCVWNYNDSLSPHKCVGVGTTGLASPAGLVSYFAHDGQNLLVNWDTENQTANRYQVLVAANEIPMTRLRFNKDVYVFNTSRPPFSVTLPQVLHDVSPLYVGIRSLTDDGYTSDMSQVSAIHMSDWLTRKEDASSSTGFFWGVCAAVLLSALCMTVLFIVVRRRANAFNMLHSFTMRNHQDDDDNPPISGFSDDEPLVIA